MVKNAVLVDDDEPGAHGEEADEVNFTIVDLDSGEVEGLAAWTERDSRGQEEVWLLPSDID